MMHHWHNAVDKSQCVRTVFVDFAKAFDHVDHNILIVKMCALDLPDIIIRWMYCTLSSAIDVSGSGDILSDWLQMVAGMPHLLVGGLA